MGFFSWMTADTNESIASRHSNRPCKPVYLLQPGEQEPIEETAYEGYGVFGGTDAYEWLARNNLSDEEIAKIENTHGGAGTEEAQFALRLAGINSEHGCYYLDTENDNKAYTIFQPLLVPVAGKHTPESITHIGKTFDEPIEEFGGLTANNVIASGRLQKREIPGPATPLKFSFDKNAVYENLPASESCPDQGYFYPGEDEEEEEEDYWDDCSDDEDVA